jgi:hypothetical protein
VTAPRDDSAERQPGKPPILILVGGMLGAGKTTLILEAARRLMVRGLRVGIVTNDQGTGLVDTALAAASGIGVGEIAGGCFCCRLSQLIDALEALERRVVDVVFAEPVGSCIDITASVINPLLRDYPHRFRVAPFTVLVDPARARQMAQPAADPDVSFLFHRQIEEADVVCATKVDRAVDHAIGMPAHRVSAQSGEGVDEWLDLVLGGTLAVGRTSLDVDYARYAAAEAALGWLNWQVDLTLETAMPPAAVVGVIGERLQESLTRARLGIVHVKVLDQTPTGFVRAHLCGPEEDAVPEGMLDASPARDHHLLVNARAIGDPDVLARVVPGCVDGLGRTRSKKLEAFRPAFPRPERRVPR